MILFSWNYRGIRRKPIQEFLSYACRTQKPALLLQETHDDAEQSTRAIKCLGNQLKGDFQPAEGASGGSYLFGQLVLHMSR